MKIDSIGEHSASKTALLVAACLACNGHSSMAPQMEHLHYPKNVVPLYVSPKSERGRLVL
jgi:hypothetical protein